MAEGQEITRTPRARTRATVVDRLARSPAVLDAEVFSELKTGALEGVQAMRELLTTGEPREQADAARVLVGAYVQLRKDSPESVNPSLATREARVAHMRAAFRDPDDELLEAMRAEADAIRKVLPR